VKNYKTLQEIRNEILCGNLTCEKLIQYHLENIEKNKHLNAFIEIFEQEALNKAKEVDVKIKSNTVGKLGGMVIGIKDVLCYKDHKLQASSKILEGFVSQYTATAIQRLLDEDAIIIGRQNCDEFAMGSSNETSYFGPVRNAMDPERVPGGSSGGSAVAVQANLCQASIGSDTGGSVRLPAAFCGVIGLKPTYSRISRYGLIAYGSSFDCIGPITKSIEDAALLLEVMAGPDEFDSTVSHKYVEHYSEQLDCIKGKKLKIGYLKQGIESLSVQTEIREAVSQCVNMLKDEGHEVIPFELPYMDKLLPVYYILTTAEASTNLSRYDGVRFGYRSPFAVDIESLYKKTREEGFGKEVKKRIMLGTFVLSANYFDAFYSKAQKVRRLIKESTEGLFTKFDFLIIPTSPTTAFKLGEKNNDPLAMYLADIFTVHANLAGVPAISVPFGKDNQHMPIGIQIVSNYFSENQLLSFAKYLLNLQQQEAIID